MRIGVAFFSCLFILHREGMCCTSCNPKIREAIFDSTFYPNLLVMLSTFLVVAVIVAVLSFMASRRERARTQLHPYTKIASPLPLTAASMVLGIGLGGFADGILLHQVLQWHEMLSNKLPPITVVAKSVNMFWDGVFHLFCLAVVLVGVILLWKVVKRKEADHSGRILAGGMLLGWGLFNVVEGIIDHHLLKLHNVRESSLYVDAWNYGFLLASLAMMALGYLLIKTRRPVHQSPRADV